MNLSVGLEEVLGHFSELGAVEFLGNKKIPDSTAGFIPSFLLIIQMAGSAGKKVLFITLERAEFKLIMTKEFNPDNEIESNFLSLSEKLDSLPTSPGIYQFFNKSGKIIYIGKAKNLRNRVRSYFQNSKPVDAKTKALIAKISDLDIIVVDSEVEALILEDTLIKKHKPKYNILLRDDKSFPYVRLTNEPFPKVFTTRKIVKDGSKYFGPFTDARHLKQLMKTLRSLFKFRSCDLKLSEESIAKQKFKICLDYHIQKCEGPCEAFITRDYYQTNVSQAIQIINGKTRELESQLEKEMSSLSDELKFEEAAKVRNKLNLLRDYTSKQKIISNDMLDRDVFGLARVHDSACTLILKIREGKVVGKRHYVVNNSFEQSDEAILRRTIEQWYLENEFIPDEIYLPAEPEDFDFLLDWLSKIEKKSISIQIPKQGDKKKIVALASANAEFVLREYQIAIAKREQLVSNSVLALQRDLRLTKPPVRIECFDNSHLQGTEIVSSLVVFQNGKAKKSDYRKFKIQSVQKNDDFASMQEVVRRRYSRIIAENLDLPDLIIIDGGKGQLSHAVEVLKELNIFDKVQIIGLAKKLEEVFFPGKSDSIILPKTSSSLRLIQQVRNEAHRFAITFHRLLRDKRTLQTELTNIDGIGEKTAQKLLIEFGSVKSIKELNYEQLENAIGKNAAIKIIEHFTKKADAEIIETI